MPASHQQSLSSEAPALQRGWNCLRQRAWLPARDAFREALAADERSAQAWEGLGSAEMCLDDVDASRSAWERAYREYCSRQDVRAAARMAMQLAVYHEGFRGESAIASGWFERARTLLQSAGDAPEHGWLALWEAHIAIHIRGEVSKGEEHLRKAILLNDTGRIGGELGLLTRGLRGLMAVSEGEVAGGLRRLDEATTEAITGEMSTPHTVGWTCCYVLDACEKVRDFDRALQWLDRAWQYARDVRIAHFSGFCRSHYLGVLIWRGQYDVAEREAAQMRSEIGDIAPTYTAICDIRLGEVRRRQGRLDEAAALLEPHAADPLGMLSLAALALDMAQPQAAVDLADRYLRRVSGADRVRRLHGLDPLVRAHVQLGDLAAADAALQELRDLAGRGTTPLIRAAVDDLQGVAAEAQGHLDAARRFFEDALDQYDLNTSPYEAVLVRLRLAGILQRLKREESAVRMRDTARSAAERLGATRLVQLALAADDARASQAVANHPLSSNRPSPPAKAAVHALSAREMEVLALVAQGVTNQEIGARLCISAFTVKRHIANILNKLNLPTRAAAAAFAVREGFVS
jgi:LuxR family maltose regulon positive regulatory protein